MFLLPFASVKFSSKGVVDISPASYQFYVSNGISFIFRLPSCLPFSHVRVFPSGRHDECQRGSRKFFHGSISPRILAQGDTILGSGLKMQIYDRDFRGTIKTTFRSFRSRELAALQNFSAEQKVR